MTSTNVNVDDIETAEPFKSLFPITQATLQSIEQDMRERGYDPAQPISLWKGIVVDGHTRLQAAKRIGFIEIPAVAQDFESEDEAVLYAIHCQKDRRNSTQADIVRWIRESDRRRTKAEVARAGVEARTNQASNLAKSTDDPHKNRSAHETAEIVGVNRGTVECVRYVDAHASDEIKEAMEKGEMKVHTAARKAREEREEAEAAKQREGSKQTRVKEVYSDGLKFAAMAIGQLRRIHPKDTQREAAFQKVQEWLDAETGGSRSE